MAREEIREHIHVVPAHPGYYVLFLTPSTGKVIRDPIVAWRISTFRSPHEDRSVSFPVTVNADEPYGFDGPWAILTPDGTVHFPGDTLESWSSQDEWMREHMTV